MQNPTTIFLVDDHPMAIDGLVGFLSDDSKYQIMGRASNGLQALEKLKNLDVDIVMTDVQMPLMDGVDLAKALLAQKSTQKIIALTVSSEPPLIKKMLQIGVAGYLLKNSNRAEIHKAIATVMAGRQYYSPEVTQVIMDKLRGSSSASSEKAVSMITEREMEILYLVLKQKSNQEISDELFISVRTVEAHKRNLLEKTGSKNVAGLVLYALEYRLFAEF